MSGITFIQTADPIFYYGMMHQTSRTVRQFCADNGFRYESYVGVKRGHMPWQATYNRVYMLKELVDRGVTGWVFYMDADALIHDMDFDLRRYLDDKHRYAGIFCGYINKEIPYSINAGGFAINLSHVVGRNLALDYWSAVNAIPDTEFNNAAIWGKEIPEDQLILHRLLKDYVEIRGQGDCLLFERINEGYTNHGPFIRQYLRSNSPNFRSRTMEIEQEVDDILAGREGDWSLDGPGYYLPAVHPRIKTSVGKKSFTEIRTTGRRGKLTYGPYLPLNSGNYFARIYGEVRAPLNGEEIVIASSVTSEEGRNLWSSHEARIAEPCKGVILEHRFALPVDVTQAEVCVSVDEHQDIDVYAVQIHWTDNWVRES